MFDTGTLKLETGRRRLFSFRGSIFVILLFCGSLLLASLFTPYASPSHAGPMPKQTRESTSAIAGETLALGDVVCIKSTDGKAYKASATDETLRPAVGFASTVAPAGRGVRITSSGVFAGYTGLTIGQPVYLSATAGAVTQTATSGWYQQLGSAETTQSIQVKIGSPQMPPVSTTGSSGAIQYKSGDTLGGTDNATLDEFGNIVAKSLAGVRTTLPQWATFYEGTDKGNKFRRISAPAAGYTHYETDDNETILELPPQNPSTNQVWAHATASGGISAGSWLNPMYWTSSAPTGMLYSTGSGLVIAGTAGTNYTSPSSTETFTNKTYDASGTGNALKQYKYITLTHPDGCDNGNATLQTAAATPATYNQCLFNAEATAANNYALYFLPAIPDLDTSIDLRVESFLTRLGDNATDIEPTCYTLSLAVVAASSPYMPTTFANSINMPIAADASGAANDMRSATAVTLTGWGSVSGVATAGNMLVLRLSRDGANEATGCTAGSGSTVATTTGPLMIRYQSTL